MTEETQPAQVAERRIPIYGRGKWVVAPFPVPGYDGEWDDYNEFKKAAGWSQFTSLGKDGGCSLALDVWACPDMRVSPHGPEGGPAQFLIEVCAPFSNYTVGAMDVADMMDLLTRWAPGVQAAALTDLIEEAVYDGTDPQGMEHSRFAAIGALVAEGVESRHEWTARQQRRQEARRDENRREKAKTSEHGQWPA